MKIPDSFLIYFYDDLLVKSNEPAVGTLTTAEIRTLKPELKLTYLSYRHIREEHKANDSDRCLLPFI
jgi:hypothetical protein